MTDYIDLRSEDELAEHLANKIVRKLATRGPCLLVQKTFDVIAMNKEYVVTVEPRKRES